MLAIEVAFITGRYVATAYNRRTEGEWPPHPARVFSALAATHFSDALDDARARDAERDVLEWLEGQGPPHLAASNAARRDVVTVYVPDNDVGLTNADEEARLAAGARDQLAEAESASDAKRIAQARKALAKAEIALTKAIERETAVPRGAADPRHGLRVLPEHRTRQPRTFPSCAPDESRVTFSWPDATPDRAQRDALAALASRVVRLGHSSSLVAVRLVDDPPPPTWVPDDKGDLPLRVTEAGQLRALEQAYERHREEEPRVMPARPQSYGRSRPGAAHQVSASLFTDEWLVFRRVEGPQLPMTATAGLSRAVRKALMAHAADVALEMLSGHAPDGKPTTLPHLAVVPLAFVGHPHATGAILGVALVLPRATSVHDKRAIYAAVARWEAAFRQEDEDTPRIKVNLSAAGELWMERVEWGAVQASLRSEAWCSPALTWSSVTPVALDRNPGELGSRDIRSLAAAVAETEAVVRLACDRIGLPSPVRVDVLPAASWAGAAKARLYPPYPGVEGRVQRVLTHLRIEFDQPVRGPVILGAGRFAGLGLFRPEAGS